MVQAARRGDAEAFGSLYQRHYATMVWLAYSILLDRNLAEDAVQQAFVKACEKLADLKRVDRFSAWLTQICRNEAYQLARSRRRSVPQQARESTCVAEPAAEGPDLGLVKEAVAQLAPMYREIVVLHYYNRMDYRQIAQTFGIAGHTVRGRLFRARRQIERTLRKNGFPER
ncbi:MAG: sigma-70 family RNA polymerase sigma factor [Phycisphaerales bacterium]|nr:MAG: sigma-70 family RNA polymerase sigma factor [Phycisphaerales bacterium]